MSIRGRIMLALVLGAASVPVAGRQAAGGPAAPPRQPPAQDPPDESVKRQYEMLLKPDFFLLRIVSGEGDEWDTPQDDAKEFKAGEPISYRLLMLNTSGEPVTLTFTDKYDQSRPRLYKDGVLAPYRKEVAAILKAKDKQPHAMRGIPVVVQSNETASALINLRDWYEPLGEGEYRLVIRWRFVWGGEWLESPPAEFRVKP